MTTPAPYVLSLDEIRLEPVGGKAHGLARLIAMGLPVPPGFVIVGATPGRLPSDLASKYAELGGGAVAVRSSAIGEDSAQASFAGQYETILDVDGEDALVTAIEQCLASLSSDRASAYREQQHDDDAAAMCIVVQRMIEPRAAGVLFTVDPVSGRRAHVIIDAVEGLGEALVSGAASPDHYVCDREGKTLDAVLLGDTPILSDGERHRLVAEALRAEAIEAMPLDLEWAIDHKGALHWLQARPITSLGADPNELDTPLADDTHVLTRCNVGEMFPGACTPLSFSFTARSIDVGMQMMHRQVGIQSEILPGFRFIQMFHGHLFLNLSTMSETATHALGSSTDQLALSICGRPITEFEIKGSAPPPLPRRLANGARYLGYLLGQKDARRSMKRLLEGLHFPAGDDAASPEAMWRAIDRDFDAIYAAMHYHLISSATSGVMTPTLLGIIAGGNTPTEADHAEVAGLLAGAKDVESADIVAGTERIAACVRAHPEGRTGFIDAEPEAALAWLESEASGAAGAEYARYMARHGHRAIKELELRQPEWRADPIPLVKSIQIPMRRRTDADAARADARQRAVPANRGGLLVRGVTRMARAAVRSREETKSGLVAVTTKFKVAYRDLGQLLARDGRLPDADAVFFLTHDELGRLTRGEDDALCGLAASRRGVFDYQESLHFPDVFMGVPVPNSPARAAADAPDGKYVTGAAVSRGRVVGVARIVRRLEDAEALQSGEILVAPITDVGWTPYFSLISGLVTDVGSAVSHGAVVAREYGLPAVVNTRFATQVFETGDRIVIEGDQGVVRLAEAAD